MLNSFPRTYKDAEIILYSEPSVLYKFWLYFTLQTVVIRLHCETDEFFITFAAVISHSIPGSGLI